MKHFFLSLRIRVKLLAAFGSILLLSVLLIVFSITSIQRIIRFKSMNEDVDRLKLHLETLDLNVKNFLYEEFKSSRFLEHAESAAQADFDSSYQEVKRIVQRIQRSELMEADKSIQRTASLTVTLDSLQRDFRLLTALLKTRGFRDYGLEGSLRKAIHEVENSGTSFDKTDMLMLRRHEKDFFLRKDLKYQKEFNDRFESFRSKVNVSGEGNLLFFLDNYRNEFNRVVAIEEQIGLKEKEGIRGRIHRYFSLFRPQVESFREVIRKQNETQISRTKFALIITFTVQIVAGIALALIYSNLLTKSIKEIRGAMKKLASGVFPDKLAVRTTEEIGETKLAFNQFVDRLQAATTFAGHLGSGALHFQYSQEYTDDVLARSLLNAQFKLREADERQSKINWTNEGVARFNDILKNDSEDIHVLADHILRLLINYVNANQGALYTLVNEHGQVYLERIGTYAYDKKRFLQQRIEVGNGVIGQCVLEGESVYMRHIPKDFVKITSGLGEATPRNVLVVPLKYREKIAGAIEIASFGVLEKYQIEFIERIAESVASLLVGKKSTDETRKLLEESRERAATLAQQEEEMRDNAEELQATQEELERQRSDMQQEINRLRKQLSDLLQESAM